MSLGFPKGEAMPDPKRFPWSVILWAMGSGIGLMLAALRWKDDGFGSLWGWADFLAAGLAFNYACHNLRNRLAQRGSP